MLRRALYFVAPSSAEVREEPLAAPGEGEALVETLVSAVSPGTEMLIYRGQAPADMTVDATIVALGGTVGFVVASEFVT